MHKRRYYYFVAGLADLVFDNGKNYPGMSEFRQELKNHLHPDDFYLTSLLFLPSDNKNLVSFLEGKEAEWDDPGTYSRADFEEQMRICRSILRGKDILPGYMAQAIHRTIDSQEEVNRIKLRKELADGYVNLVIRSGNDFLRKWIRYETDLNNIFTFLNAKILSLDIDNQIIGDDLFAQELADLFRSEKDFPVSSFEEEYIRDIFKIATESEFLERERKIDLARWNFIDTLTVFEYFTIELILGYLIKYSIVLRWKKLDPETGKIMLKKFIDETESSIIERNIIEE
ncbi:MAG: DUF2764 family protein [Bacteroidales bacterium]|nr:DUF2764 family protein [Bacteroidales bacterium]